jgi:F-type H+-transporting ATPase subunit b
MALAIVRVVDGFPSVISLQQESTETTVVAQDGSGDEATTGDHGEAEVTGSVAVVEEPTDPSPLNIIGKELFWAGGSFLVLFALMRLVLYPRVAKSMAARDTHISAGLDQAARLRDGALADKQAYENQLASARAEATRTLDAARATVEEERQGRLAEVSARLSDHRRESMARMAQARTDAQTQVTTATAQVVTHAASKVLGRAPDAAAVTRAVQDSMTGVPS